MAENGEGNGTPLQYSCLENPMDGGAWWATVHGVAKGRTRLSDFTFTFHFHALKEMATHSSVLAWRIPGTGEPGGLPSMGSHRVGHDWSDLAAAAAAAWQRILVNKPWSNRAEEAYLGVCWWIFWFQYLWWGHYCKVSLQKAERKQFGKLFSTFPRLFCRRQLLMML